MQLPKAKAMAKLKKQDMGKKSQAEPKRARKVSKGSSESNRAEDGERARVKSFKGYDLSDLPEAALPFLMGCTRVTIATQWQWVKRSLGCAKMVA